jgi:ArsR family transcriptional regulator, cadmium/lead-responsive transcriptional repressor
MLDLGIAFELNKLSSVSVDYISGDCYLMRANGRAGAAEALEVKAKFFRGLGDTSRLAILEALREGRKNVTEVVGATGLSQPNASMHLNCLWECGLLEREVGRRYTHYWIRSKKVLGLLRMANEILEDAYERILDCKRYKDGEGRE